MKRKLLFLTLLSLLSIESFSQIIFENGYFIDDSNQKTECLVRNIDWKNNPTELEYKLTQDAAIQKAGIQTVKEFGINGGSKYIKAKVKIDKSDNNLSFMSSERNPVFEEEELFLKVLIEGMASLFYYQKGNLIRYFYRTNNSEVSQLIYKEYLLHNKVATNNSFRQQLYVDLKCSTIKPSDVENISYNTKELKRFFIKYNKCTNSGFTDDKPKHKKDLFDLSVRPGVDLSSLVIRSPIYLSGYQNTDFGSKLCFRFGLENEFILPINKYKWGLIIEPTFQYFKAEKTTKYPASSGGDITGTVNYQSIELPIGLRHYFYLNDDSKIFANISYVLDVTSSSPINFSRSDGAKLETLKIRTGGNVALGIGYKYKDRYSLEIRYLPDRVIVEDDLRRKWTSKCRTFSVVLGYSIF